ncbi:MAG: metalloregulator ArsR/SmtB family transcription factor [Chloroflexi bacterium]|nr:metalloregulator ArsR/SmtB family transcription factor [Chloroflexota bacterium]
MKNIELQERDEKLVDTFRALGNPVRLRILQVLAQRGTCICSDVVEKLPLAQSTVSQHLKVLKDAGLIAGQIEGQSVCYCIAPGSVDAFSANVERFTGSLAHAQDCCESNGACCAPESKCCDEGSACC